MNGFRISYFGSTDVGRKRQNNEDTFITGKIWDENHILLVVIDGMGGEEGGEVAAEIARETIKRYLEEYSEGEDIDLIKRAVADANNEIVKNKEVQPMYARMGCVVTAGIINLERGTLSVAHVGDSRLYRYSNGELTKLTHDHSLVGYQEEKGILSEEEAMHHPRRSVIERCLGSDLHLAEDKYFIETGIFPLVDGESFIFCSDGLCDMLTSAQISACMSDDKTTEQECLLLIERANQAGGKDNITVIVAKIESEGDRSGEILSQSVSFIDSPKEEKPQQEGQGSLRTRWIVVLFIVMIIFATLGFWFSSNRNATNPIPEPASGQLENVVASDSLKADSLNRGSLETDSLTMNQDSVLSENQAISNQ